MPHEWYRIEQCATGQVYARAVPWAELVEKYWDGYFEYDSNPLTAENVGKHTCSCEHPELSVKQ